MTNRKLKCQGLRFPALLFILLNAVLIAADFKYLDRHEHGKVDRSQRHPFHGCGCTNVFPSKGAHYKSQLELNCICVLFIYLFLFYKKNKDITALSHL